MLEPISENIISQTYLVEITGLVQGVGFRPFVYQIAHEFNIKGTVENRNNGVFIYLNATNSKIRKFIDSIKRKAPHASSIDKIAYHKVPSRIFDQFSIAPSKTNSSEITEISPDIAVCSNCLEDLKLQANRTNYPFINCTHCGPRFSIIKELPYDRHFTTMQPFVMCPQCAQEYENIADRRFHAQPVACNSCGPHYTLIEKERVETNFESILKRISALLNQGEVIAIKGLGGFHLMCNAYNFEAVAKIRTIKNRDKKPFAVMCPDIQTANEIAWVSKLEEQQLLSWQRPIVLLQSKQKLGKGISGSLNTIGIMLPYLPLHYLLFEHLKTNCIVLTSGNLSDEPITIDNDTAIQTFKEITAAVVTNNREIYNRCDDSVTAIFKKTPVILRRSRGYAPSPIKSSLLTEGIFGAGSELVNCFAMGKANQVILSQYMGDLKNKETLDFYTETFTRFSRLFKFSPSLVVNDLHPNYLSSKFAGELAEEHRIPIISVQHHHAHIAACMAEYNMDEPIIGVSMDGVGLGTDGQIWGGEFFIADLQNFERAFHFEYVPISGADHISSQPWRSALAYLKYYYGNETLNLDLPFIKNLNSKDVSLYMQLLDKKVNSINYSSAGRLFDAVSAILQICVNAGYHAEAPMLLESAINPKITSVYPFEIIGTTISFKLMFAAIVRDINQKLSISAISAKFHNTIAKTVFEVSRQIADNSGINKVIISGGTFQNRYLTEKLIKIFHQSNLKLYVPSRIPANDGGIALGQVMIAAKRRKNGEVN